MCESELEFGEKGRLGALITGTGVAAFAASNLYVLGLSTALHQNLATYFEILDYVQLTPAWAVPGLLGLAGIISTFCLVNLLILSEFVPLKSRSIVSSFGLWGISFFLIFLAFLLMKLNLPTSPPPAALLPARAGAWVLLTGGVALFAGLAIDLLVTNTRLKVPKVLQAFIPLTIGTLCFAFCYGWLVAPILIQEGSIATVRVSQEGPSIEGHIDLPGKETKLSLDQKESIVTGRIVFRLPHSLILLSESDNKSLIVLPEEKIEKVVAPQRPSY
jgi:hypothetical protein